MTKITQKVMYEKFVARFSKPVLDLCVPDDQLNEFVMSIGIVPATATKLELQRARGCVRWKLTFYMTRVLKLNLWFYVKNGVSKLGPPPPPERLIQNAVRSRAMHAQKRNRRNGGKNMVVELSSAHMDMAKELMVKEINSLRAENEDLKKRCADQYEIIKSLGIMTVAINKMLKKGEFKVIDGGKTEGDAQ